MPAPDDRNLREGWTSGKTSVSRIVSCTPCSTDCSARIRRRRCARGDRPQEWERSPLLTCFHPSVEQLFAERVAIHRNLEHWRQLGRRRKGAASLEPRPEPRLDDMRRAHEPSPVNAEEEVTEVVGLCLWDILSDNHEVIAADGPVAHIGSFRGAGAFLDAYLACDQEGWRDGDYIRFYMGNDLDLRRADLTPVYAMIFRCLRHRTPTVYHFLEIAIVELAPANDMNKRDDR
jgi:hypothetical protein